VNTRSSVLIVGAGGIGTPAALALGAAGVRRVAIADDDVVDISNLHRQILFTDNDVGQPKPDALAAALRKRFVFMRIIQRPRALPDNVLESVRAAEVVIDATDNFASRFLLSDACALAGVAVVHAAAIRWHATVLAVEPGGKPCYRCLFEDLPEEAAPDCATAGVAGPVCGVAGAIAADRAIRLLSGDRTAAGAIVTYDGRRDVLRQVRVKARKSCPLCGDTRTIQSIDPTRYEAKNPPQTGDDPSWRSPSAFQPPCAH
jgi:molybdopterin/thiamine biosynthesis adenylyltransferase